MDLAQLHVLLHCLLVGVDQWLMMYLPTHVVLFFPSLVVVVVKIVHDSCWELMIMSSPTNSQTNVDSTTNKRVINYVHKGIQIMKPKVNQPHDYISWGCMWLNDHRFFIGS